MSTRIISYIDVMSLLGVSRVTLWRWLKDGQSNLPQPIRIGTRKLGFVEAEIDEWIATNRRVIPLARPGASRHS